MPPNMYDTIENVAKNTGISKAKVSRKAIKIGLGDR